MKPTSRQNDGALARDYTPIPGRAGQLGPGGQTEQRMQYSSAVGDQGPARAGTWDLRPGNQVAQAARGALNVNLTATLTRLLNVGWRPLTGVTATPGGAHAGRFSRGYPPLSRPRPSPGVTSGLPLGHRCASGLTTLPAPADRALDQVR